MDLFDEYSKDELLLIPIKNLGLNRQPWSFTRGMMLTREFKDDGDVLRADITYTYTMSDGNRVATPATRVINWYNTDGSIGLTKTDTLTYSIKDLKHEHRKIRQGRIDYMIAGAEELATLSAAMPEPYKTSFMQASQSIDFILTHYEVEIDHYTKRGTTEFEDAVRNETDQSTIDILNLVVRPPDAEFASGLTIKQTILHQLTGEYDG